MRSFVYGLFSMLLFFIASLMGGSIMASVFQLREQGILYAGLILLCGVIVICTHMVIERIGALNQNNAEMKEKEHNE